MIKNATKQPPTFLHWDSIPVNTWFRLAIGGIVNCLHYKINASDSICVDFSSADKKLIPCITKDFMKNNSQGNNKMWQLCDVTEIQFMDK